MSLSVYCLVVKLTLDAQDLDYRLKINPNAYLKPKRESPCFLKQKTVQNHIHCAKNRTRASCSQRITCFVIQDKNLIKMLQDKTFNLSASF